MEKALSETLRKIEKVSSTFFYRIGTNYYILSGATIPGKNGYSSS